MKCTVSHDQKVMNSNPDRVNFVVCSSSVEVVSKSKASNLRRIFKWNLPENGICISFLLFDITLSFYCFYFLFLLLTMYVIITCSICCYFFYVFICHSDMGALLVQHFAVTSHQRCIMANKFEARLGFLLACVVCIFHLVGK